MRCEQCMLLKYITLKTSVWLGVFMLQNLETALAGGLGQMSLVNDYQTFQPNLGSSSLMDNIIELAHMQVLTRSRWRNGWLFLGLMQRCLFGLPLRVSGGGT